MEDPKTLGITIGQGKYHEDMVYGVALLYNLINNEITDYLKEFGLSPAKFNSLMTIKHQGREEGISQVEISKRLIVTPSNMTRLLDKLEGEKLVMRYSKEGDRRVNRVKITDKGSKILDKAWPGYIEKVKSLTVGMPEEDKKTFSRLLIRWFEKINQI
jgi:MarR family transcriptional regulator, 2-MHQ and catechol-resistance regulon repressor